MSPIPTEQRAERFGFAEETAGNYFISTYPPFSTWRATEADDAIARVVRTDESRPVGLYVHVPYCAKKCDYCYYLSFAARPENEIDAYLDAILRELDLWIESGYLGSRELSFAYFGGGTPSILAPEQIARLGAGLRKRLPWDRTPEITFECAPRTMSAGVAAALRDMGVTRASMGVQSFSDDVLRRSGRVHLRDDILRAWQILRDTGFDWTNLDLMAGLPGESASDWEDSLRNVLELDPQSVTVYQTELPRNTKLFRDWERGAIGGELASWSEKRRRVHVAFEALEAAGFRVVNAYSAVRDPELHRFLYQDRLWNGADMLGVGIASYSYIDGVHFQNSSALRGWKNSLDRRQLPIARAHRLSPEEEIVRDFILEMKCGRVKIADLSKRRGEDVEDRYRAELDFLANGGYLRCREGTVELTRQGLIAVDAITPLFYLPEHRSVRYT